MFHRVVLGPYVGTSRSGAADVLRRLFPGGGEYLVKAVSTEAPTFETWFLDELYQRAQDEQRSLQELAWDALDGLLTMHGVQAPSELEAEHLYQALFDLAYGATSTIVGMRVPDPLRERLDAMGVAERDQLDFPGIAYRIGKIYETVKTEPPGPGQWERVQAAAQSVVLLPSEEIAVEQSRRRAGQYLRPLFDQGGQVWVSDREATQVRELTSRALASREGPRKAARELAATNRAEGVFRDADRVMRTEIATERSRGQWEAQGWDADTRVFRQVQATPCKPCVRLYTEPNGMPKLYRAGDVAAWSETVNTGPQAGWTAKIGATHPNCVCAPWAEWFDEVAFVYEGHAERLRKLRATVGLG